MWANIVRSRSHTAFNKRIHIEQNLYQSQEWHKVTRYMEVISQNAWTWNGTNSGKSLHFGSRLNLQLCWFDGLDWLGLNCRDGRTDNFSYGEIYYNEHQSFAATSLILFVLIWQKRETNFTHYLLLELASFLLHDQLRNTHSRVCCVISALRGFTFPGQHATGLSHTASAC